jgi:hypothetical protein
MLGVACLPRRGPRKLSGATVRLKIQAPLVLIKLVIFKCIPKEGINYGLGHY